VGKYCRAGQATDDNIIWRMSLAYWIPKATNTHSEYVILLLHCNIGCTYAPKCYVVRTSPVFLQPEDRDRYGPYNVVFC